MKESFAIRAVEVHDRVWDQQHVSRVLDFMAANNMNTLILHANDIIDSVVWPAYFYGAEGRRDTFYQHYKTIYKKLYMLSASRRYMPVHRRDYLHWVIRRAARTGIKVFLQNKELWFPDYIQEVHPDICKQGRFCCSEPFWLEFIRVKYRELMADFPGLGGVITSPGSRESKLSVTSNRCECSTCKALDSSRWYTQLITAIYQPVHEAGKKLVVRDFVFDSGSQLALSAAMDRFPSDIALSLKNTPHDFYPTFPDNPKIAEKRNNETWVEFDAMGQYFGWGIGVCILAGDWQRRFKHAAESGAGGIVVRSDWEGLPGHSCFDTLNIINTYAAALLAEDVSTPRRDIYRRWLEAEGMVPPGSPADTVDECAAWLGEVLDRTWDVVRKAIFMDDYVFSDSSALPVGLEHAFWLAEEKNSLSDWLAGKARTISPTLGNLEKIVAEKEQACSGIRELLGMMAGNRGLSDTAHKHLQEQFEYFAVYVEGFSLVGQIAILARRLEADPTDAANFRLVRERLGELRQHAAGIDEWLSDAERPFPVFALLNPERMRIFHDDVAARLKVRA